MASNADISVNAASATFMVGNTGSATNGQVKITSFSVTYETSTTGINNNNVEKQTNKHFDGKQIVIVKNNKKYNVLGQRL